jgi:hypothetical protein
MITLASIEPSQLLVNTRQFANQTTTVGLLTHSGQRVCRTLEDRVRPKGVFVPQQTAIEEGIYEVVVTMSPRMKRLTGLLKNVPHHGEGLIRAHRGEVPADSAGCILLGMTALNWQLDGCKDAEDKVTALLVQMLQRGKVYIQIINAFGPLPA